MSINDFMLFHSRKLESLRTCMDFNDFARERIYERIPPKASSLEKTACVARMSAESLKWLIDDTHTRYNRLNRKARGQRLSPFVFQRASRYPNYWLFEVVKACILAGSFPLESKGRDSLAPDCQSNPEFNKHWPKTPGATAFWGAGMSVAKAISGALLMFLEKSFLWYFPDLPNYIALRPGLCELYDKENLERNFSETGDVLPLIPTWQNLSLGSVVEYISPAEWPPAKLDREYSRVMNLINHEATLAQTEQEANALTKDEMITITEAAKLLGVNAGTVSRWTTDGIIKDNGEAKRKRRLSKISVLLLKDKREREDRLKDAADVLQDMEHKIPDRH